MSGRLAGAAAAALILGFPSALSARGEMPPIRIETRWLTAGDSAVIHALHLEAGRLYTVRVTLSGLAAPSEEAWLDVTIWSGKHKAAEGRLDRMVPALEGIAVPPRPNSVRVEVNGGGELGAQYEARVEWQAAPAARMAAAGFLASPNQGTRPPGATVSAVVVHATVIPTIEQTVYWFLTPASQVSAHYVVGQDGTIVQMVEDSGRAWHAGVSELEGAPNVNDFSVGIEVVNRNDGVEPFTDAQYRAVASIIHHLREQYAIPDSRIVSHEFVARPPGRKNDPQGFDFDRLKRLAHTGGA